MSTSTFPKLLASPEVVERFAGHVKETCVRPFPPLYFAVGIVEEVAELAAAAAGEDAGNSGGGKSDVVDDRQFAHLSSLMDAQWADEPVLDEIRAACDTPVFLEEMNTLGSYCPSWLMDSKASAVIRRGPHGDAATRRR